MKQYWKYAGALAMVVLLAGYASAMSVVQNESKTFEGELLSIDATTKVLSVKGADDKQMKFTMTEKTEIIGADSTIQGLAGKSGTRLKVHYTTSGEVLTATRIEVIPS
jgi:hypothetical protein